MLGYVKQLQSLGAKITMNAIDIETELLSPLNMVDFNGVIEDNIKPFRLSWFTNKYREVIGVFDEWTRNSQIEVIDLADHLCWQDECHVLSPSGHGVYVDGNHYGKFYVRHWMTGVDHLTVFK
jgi:hypothetical protein